MADYEKQDWTDNETLINADHMNHIEDGIESAHEKADTALTGITVNGESAPVNDHVAEITIDASGGVYYGSCETPSSNAEKIVKCDLAELKPGITMFVWFDEHNVSDDGLALNVNGLGAKEVFVGEAIVSADNPFRWATSTGILFVYDNVWVPVGCAEDYYFSCDDTADVTAHSITAENVVLKKGTRVTVNAKQLANNDTLNIGGAGVIPIELSTKVYSNVTLVFNGSAFVVDDVWRMANVAESDSQYAASDASEARSVAYQAQETANATADSAITAITVNGEDVPVSNNKAEITISGNTPTVDGETLIF